MILRDRLEFENNLAREKESGERSFGLLQQLRIVQNPAQLKTVAGRFTMHHWLGWRARMPSHVQRRSRLPSAGRADLVHPLRFSQLQLIEPKRS
ncbi:hypothetical protein BVRB_031130 [Beta vulgaris subsp. vulgaris]|uniref:Uncharacterized protein n=1 Tax=Beta vulgaris subsp. vulgaris TaxID=3555 RepID=A0A0J8B0P2_BETVV|nr:hypothetical protein BVRB_031130 [Beta vulgaris subsp. vulgaris]